MKGFCMFDAYDAIKAVIAIIMFVAIILIVIVLFKDVLAPAIELSDAKENISAGTVVDKEIINARSGLFSSSGIDYRLTIEGEFEYRGETVTGKKSISVDKETYQQASLGDWFDVHTLEITKSNADSCP